jgi:hypothetical protein
MNIKRIALGVCFLLLLLSAAGTGSTQSSSRALFWYAIKSKGVLNIQAYDPSAQQSHPVLTILIDENAVITNAPIGQPALSADGRWLAYLVRKGQFEVHVVNLKTAQDHIAIQSLTTTPYNIIADPRPTLEWSADGKYLLIRGYDTFYVYAPDTESLRPVDTDNPIPPGHMLWSDQGNLFLVKMTCTIGIGCVTSATLIDIETLDTLAFYGSGNITTFTAPAMCELQLSPDKRYLVYMASCEAGAPDVEKEVYLYDTLTDTLSAITSFTSGISLDALYTARYDLTWVDADTLFIGAIYRNALGDKVESYRYNATAQTLTSILNGYGQDWTLSPNGNQVAYRVMDNFSSEIANYAIRVTNIQDLSIRTESNGIACNFIWSSDGNFLAFSMHETSSYYNVCDYPVEQLKFMDISTGQVIASMPALSDEIFPLGWVQTSVVDSLTLIDPATGSPVDGFNPLVEGAQLELATLPSPPFSIRANVGFDSVASVVFDLNGVSQIDNAAPYEFANWFAEAGNYNLTVTPYGSANGQGIPGAALTITFTVIGVPTPTPTMTETPTSVATSTPTATFTITPTLTPTPSVTPTATLTSTATLTATSTPIPTSTLLPPFTPLSACWVKHWNGQGQTEWHIDNPNPVPLSSSPEVKVRYNWTAYSQFNAGGSVVQSASGWDNANPNPVNTPYAQSLRLEWYLVVAGQPTEILGSVVVNADASGSCTPITPTPTPPPAGSGTGLRGEYYNKKDFTRLALTRTDATVNFDWGKDAPAPEVQKNAFSVRWTGQVQPRYSETYTFYAVSDDGVRVWVNGQPIINNWNNHSVREDSGTITLVAGQRYDIQIDYYEDGGDAVIKLLWSSPSQAKEVIPQSQLYPPAP